MRKSVRRILDRRTIIAVMLLLLLITISSFLIPVPDDKLTASPWCGIGGHGLIKDWIFHEDGTLQFKTLVMPDPDTHSTESGTWVRDGIKIKADTIEIHNAHSSYLTVNLSPVGWGNGLLSFQGDYLRQGGKVNLLFIRPCS